MMGLTALMRSLAILVISGALTGRFYNAGQAFLEEPDKLPPHSRETATMAPHVVVEVSVFDLHGPPVTLVCVYYRLLLRTF